MRIFRTTILTIVAAAMALAAASCQKDDTLYYNNLTMGNIVDGRFVSDQGNTFNIVDQTCEGKLDTMDRVITLCDVLNVTSGMEKEYDVRLRDYAPVLTKNAVKSEEAVSEEISVTDPIYIEHHALVVAVHGLQRCLCRHAFDLAKHVGQRQSALFG